MPAAQSAAKNRCEAQAADEERSVVGRHGITDSGASPVDRWAWAKIEHKSERREEDERCEARKPSTLLLIGATAQRRSLDPDATLTLTSRARDFQTF